MKGSETGRPVRPITTRLAALAFIGAALAGCIFTLPFDDLTGAVPRGGPPPTSRYPLDETGGSIASDISGLNPGVLQTETPTDFPKWTPDGKRGGGLEFGLDGWVNVAKLSGALFPKVGTIAVWVRVHEYLPNDEEGVDETPIFEIDDGDETDSPLYVFMTASNINFERAAPNDQYSISSTPSVPLDTWVLVVAGWDIPHDTAILFVRPDGKEPFPLQQGNFPVGFVVDSPDFDVYTQKGTIDDVRFYDRLLTAEELLALD